MEYAYSSLAAIYDRLMTDVDYDGWAEYLANLICEGDRGGVSIAECACGTGEIMLRLLQMGFAVAGLDISPDMLLVAREKLRLSGFMSAPLIMADMRRFTLHRPVDAVVCACDGVNYLLSDGAAADFFHAAFGALKPGGMLLFDISSSYKLRNVLDGHTYGEDLEDCAYLWQNGFDEESRVLQMDLSIFVRESDGRYRKSEETHRQRAYEEAELKMLLTQSGFQSVRSFDAFTRNPPHKESERIQFTARRPKHG